MPTAKPASSGDEGRNVKAGEVILTCEPWITVVDWTMRSKVCAFCWTESDDLSACNGCRYCFYCDRTCQTSDWRREHKHECGLLKAAVDELSPDAIKRKSYGSLQILFPKALNRCAVTLAPFFALKNIMVRAERVDVWSWKMEMAEAISPGWNCDCVYCSDKFEAEILPIKCVTASSMEPIPNDKRALEPCQQCGAINGHRLADAKAQITEFTKKLLEFGGRHEKPLYSQHGPEWLIGKMVALVKEMEAARVVLHLENMIKMGAAYILTMGMTLSRIPAMGFRYAEMCRETVQNLELRGSKIRNLLMFDGCETRLLIQYKSKWTLGVIRSVPWMRLLFRRYYGKGLHPHYSLFLMLYAKCELAMCDISLTKKNSEAAKNLLQLALQKRPELLAMPRQAEKIMNDFFRTDSSAPDVKSN